MAGVGTTPVHGQTAGSGGSQIRREVEVGWLLPSAFSIRWQGTYRALGGKLERHASQCGIVARI